MNNNHRTKPKAAMGGRMAGMMSGDKAKDFKGAVRKLAGHLAP